MTAEPRTATSITIRGATPDDIPALVAMVNAAYRKSEGHVFPTTDRVDRTRAMDQISEIEVAVVGGQIAGCVRVDLSGEAAYFGLLSTDLSRQRSGIASMLIEHAERMARDAGHTLMRIDVIREGGNVPFYERRGYRILRETDGQVWNGGQDWGAAAPWHMVDMEKPL
jgi:GNAT superfamily N-acetyltransferase